MVEHEIGRMGAVELGEAPIRLVQELVEHARLPEPAGTRILRITANCGATSTALRPDLASWRGTPCRSWHVALERRLVAVQEHHDRRRRPGSKPLGSESRTRWSL